MDHDRCDQLDERVLLLALTARDGEASQRVLGEAGILCTVCADLTALCVELPAGAGVVLLPEEALASEGIFSFLELLKTQPPWSDLPVIVLTHNGMEAPFSANALEHLGNVTLVDRPVRIKTLISAVRTALRARRRQYQLREHLAERRRAEEALRDADRRKDEFLATLAHELRNPLAPVRNAVQLMKLSDSDGSHVRWCRDVIERQVNHLTRLIDDLLDISRIARDKLELRKQRVALADVVNGAVEMSRPVIEQFGHRLSVTLPPEPVLLDADLVRLAQVFMNLLNNAAKYTEQGGEIFVSAERGEREAVVRVRDTGMGIPPEKLPELFEMFFQVDRSMERSEGGLGIGLSLVRRLVEMHGGTVEAHSEGVGHGSEFVVRLPVLAQTAANTLVPLCDVRAPGKMRKRRVLVVDDNKDAADSLSLLLCRLGHEVFTAYDGLEGFERAADVRPEVAFLDIGMPRLNGYDVAKRIREQPWGRELTLVALTGWGQEDDRERAHRAGFNHHYVKPVGLSNLAEVLA